MDSHVDPGLAALIADPRLALRPPPHVALPDLRRAANAFLARATGPALAEVRALCAGSEASGVPLRLYRPSDEVGLSVILFLHGGGFVFGSLDTHDAMCRTLALASGAAVIAVDYRLAPEHAFPAAQQDVAVALDWLADAAPGLGLDIDRLALAGDSAGGQLALAAALGPHRLRHLALIYPLLDPRRGSRSARDYADGYMLTGAFLDWAWRCYAGTLDDPSIDLTQPRIARLAPTTIVTAGFDPLRDEGEAFAAHLAAIGVPVAHRRYAGMIHGFAGLPHLTAVANEALSFVAARLAAALQR